MSLNWEAIAQAFVSGVNALFSAGGAIFSAMFNAIANVFTDPNVVAIIAWVTFFTVIGQLMARALGINPLEMVRNVFAGVTGWVGRIFGGLF